MGGLQVRVPAGFGPPRLPGLPMFGTGSFSAVLHDVQRPRSAIHMGLQPYADRFAQAMACPTLLRQCSLAAVSAGSWDASLGPALALLSKEALGTPMSPAEVRMAIVGDVTDAARIQVNTELFASLLRTAGVRWAHSC